MFSAITIPCMMYALAVAPASFILGVLNFGPYTPVQWIIDAFNGCNDGGFGLLFNMTEAT